MQCRVIREPESEKVERVLAPNRKDSILHEHILEAIPENYQPDMYVQLAYQKGNIKNLSKDEMALALWSKVNTPPFREGIGKMDMKYLDKNGEPFFSVIHEKLGLHELAADYQLSGPAATQAFIQTLEDRGFIYSWEGGYRVSANQTFTDDARTGEEQNKMKIQQSLAWAGIPEEFVSFTTKDTISYAEFDPSLFNITERIREGNDNANTLSLIRFLNDRFPQLKFEFLSAKEGKDMLQNIYATESEEKNKVPDFNKVNSFVHKGTVYLINDRITDEIVIEEALHPFVHTIAQTNKELFDNLLEGARKEFPALRKQVSQRYTEESGFTDADRDQELVTQALSKVWSMEREENEESSLRDQIQKMLEWFARLLQEFVDIIAGENKLTIDAGMLSSATSLTDLAKLLNTYDSKFIVDVNSSRANFSLSTEQEAFQTAAKEGAENQLQAQMVDDLFFQDDPVLYDVDSGTYLNTKGISYRSLTATIDGRTNTDGKEGLEKLFGKNAARVLEGLCLGKSFSEIRDQITDVDEGIASRAYGALEMHLARLVNSSSVLIPYVVMGDHQRGIAATMDIVVVEPNGKMELLHIKVSPDSMLDARYKQEELKVGSASNWKDKKLTAHLQHGIKVAASTRLMENNGYPVERTISVHIHLPEKTMRAKEGYDFKIEDTQVHSPSENNGWVNEILPDVTRSSRVEELKKPLGMNNPVDDLDFLSDEERMPEEEIKEPFDKATVKEQKRATGEAGRLAKTIERLMRSVKFRPKSQMVQKLSELITFVQHDLSRGEAELAFGRFVRSAQSELEKINNFLVDESKQGTNEYIRVAVEAEWYIKTYEGIVNAFNLSLGSHHQKSMVESLQKMLSATESRIQLSQEEHVLNRTRSLSKRKLNNKQWEELIEEEIDTSKVDYYLNDIDTSKDALVAIAAKTYKMARLSAMERMREFDKKVKAKGNKLAEIEGGQPNFDWMTETNEKGQNTGRIVQKIGEQLGKLLEPLEKKLYTINGILKQYRSIYSLQDATAEDIEYNKVLQKDKEALRNFKQAEIQSETGYSDGTYYKLTAEFKAERDKNEVYMPIVKNGKFIKGVWKKKDGVTDLEYYAYKRKYYNEAVYDKPVFENNEFTGIFIKDGGRDWFVKPAHVEIREVSGNGINMVSKRWEQMQKDTSPLGIARLDFYNFYVSEMGDTLKILPPNVQQNMQGKMPRLRKNFIQRLKKGGAFFQVVAETVTGWFSIRTYPKAALYNEDGTIMNQIPIFLTGNLRDEEVIEQLKKELKQLDVDYKDKKIGRENYLQQRSEKAADLRAVEQSVGHDELNTDMVENLIAFRAMAENYVHLDNIEGSMNAVLRVLEKRKYWKLDNKGKKKMIPNTGEFFTVEGKESYTFKRFKKWMEMTFYNSDDLDSNTFDVVSRKLMGTSSLVNVGFNTFGGIHNYIMARINTAIESAGGLFYTRKAAARAMMAYTNDFLTGYFTSMGKSEGYYYKTKLPGSKYEALVSFFNMIRKNQSGENKVDILAPGYLVQEAGEYAAQSKSGIAYLMSEQLESSINPGETLSIFDAFDFDKSTGQLTLKKGFSLPENMRHQLTNKIWEMNKQIHGSYSWEDRMVIQEHTLGRIAAQFHKWVYPMYKARFRRRYFDENLGELEGRYLSVYNFFKYMYEAEGNILQKLKAGWKKLDEIQIKNMYRNAAEISFFILAFGAYGLFRSMAEDDDDDSINKKRWINFMGWESNRAYKEILFWIPGLGTYEQLRLIKNPFAIGPAVDQFVGVVSEGMGILLPPYDDEIYYKKGPFEGELRFKKEFLDLLPVMKDINKWRSFSQVTNFYIK